MNWVIFKLINSGKLMSHTNRLIFFILAPLIIFAGCSRNEKYGSLSAQQKKFINFGMELRTDAIPGYEAHGVEIFADDEKIPFYGKSLLSIKTNEIMAYPTGGILPERIRVVWYVNPEAYYGPGGIRFRGEVAGDYKIDVASRIPDAVVKELKRDPRGNLRIKFRLARRWRAFWLGHRATTRIQAHS